MPDTPALLVKKQKKIAEIEKYGLETAGRNRYLKYLRGERVTQREGILAYCYDCQGWYMDGKTACLDPLCPLFTWTPFTHTKVKSDQPPRTGQYQPKQNAI